MLPGVRDAPTTATACGSNSGRSDAAVASASRRSAAFTDAPVGSIDSCTFTQPRSDFDRISNPDS